MAMTKEEKQLLWKDLCARLPYRVRCKCVNGLDGSKTEHGVLKYIGNCNGIISNYYEDIPIDSGLVNNMFYPIENIKPYLRPMESMTEEDLISYANYDFANNDTYKIVDYRCPPGKGFINLYCSSIRHPEDRPVIFQRTRTSPLENWRGIDWLNEHHFDYRNLIKMGLAIKAPDGMYNF